eukprot:12712510-Alexandrium_andersonii.AAC.1
MFLHVHGPVGVHVLEVLPSDPHLRLWELLDSKGVQQASNARFWFNGTEIAAQGLFSQSGVVADSIVQYTLPPPDAWSKKPRLAEPGQALASECPYAPAAPSFEGQVAPTPASCSAGVAPTTPTSAPAAVVPHASADLAQLAMPAGL